MSEILHASDCAVYNAPAYEAEECDCNPDVLEAEECDCNPDVLEAEDG